jgi:NAD(P)-dependent dehydrogenase (short-subunit alcohol dehydrogenase family)
MGELSGKTAVVTGASYGIGKEITRGLALRGAKVVLVSSNATKGEQTLAELKAAVPGAELSYLPADLSSKAEIDRLAAALSAKLDRLDVLVNNAAVIPLERKAIDGVEQALAVNAYAPYLLTRALAPLLKKSAPSRVIVMVGATLPVDFDDLQFEKNYNGWQAYQRSKHAMLLLVSALTQELEGSGITVNGAFPGVVSTDTMGNAAAGMGKLAVLTLPLLRLFMRKPSKGAESALYVASSPALEKATGQLFTIGKPLEMKVGEWKDPALVKKMTDVVNAARS